MPKQQRNYAIDWMRVYCMFFICLGHFSAFAGSSAYLGCVTIWGTGTVDLFVLITGYFGINHKKALTHFLSIYLEVIFYNLLGAIIFSFLGRAGFFDIAKAFFPFAPTKFGYWFVTKYLALLLVAPFLEILLHNINNRCLIILWGVLFFLNTSLAGGFPPGNLFGGPWNCGGLSSFI